LHLTLFHPLDDLRGFAPLEAALMALDIHNAAGAWNKALLDNAARPSGALVYAPAEGGNMAPEQREQLKRDLDTEYAGAANAGRPMLLEGGLDWKAMGLTPKDMDFIEAKNAASRDIALAFGVPPMLLGIPGDNTYANYAEANRAFYRLTVLPLVARTADAFARWLGEGRPDAFARRRRGRGIVRRTRRAVGAAGAGELPDRGRETRGRRVRGEGVGVYGPPLTQLRLRTSQD
jgi:HK97 family phage portal protein